MRRKEKQAQTVPLLGPHANPPIGRQELILPNLYKRDRPRYSRTFDRCTVIGERVVAQPGGFYSGGCSIQRMYRTGQGFPAIWFGPSVRAGRRLRRTRQRSADGSAWRVKRG
jgi:hypothetical protein